MVFVLAFGVLYCIDSLQSARGAIGHSSDDRSAATSISSTPIGHANSSGSADVILVAAEGGGVRSAYWTARSLVELWKKYPNFKESTFMLTGVSGGSIGIAVFRACLRTVEKTRKISHGDSGALLHICVDDVMRKVDGLTPLLGGLVFEDILARLLPTALCRLPGCGHLSRGVLFEREWMRVLPELSEPMSRLARSGPQLAFNSTWVESGNRTVYSTMSFPAGALPSAALLKECLAEDLSLIAAAHSSARFPLINPLATARSINLQGPLGCRESGHLIDGGYFDNSAATTLLDTFRLLRSVVNEDKVIKAVVIRNGLSEPECAREFGSGDPLPDCFFTIHLPRRDSEKLAVPMDSRRWSLYVDELSALTTLLNVSGVGAHGRQATGQLVGALREQRASGGCGALLLIEQIDAGELVPLGWKLSTAARQSLDRQLASVFDLTCLGSPDESPPSGSN
jgi:hypothetical protein